MKQTQQYPGISSSTGQWQLLLTAVLLLGLMLLPGAAVHADGLFNFQMKLAQKGNAEAQFKIGEMYETGFGVNKNMEQARVWINRAAAQGHVVAGYKLMYWDLKASGINDDNREQVNQLRAKAEAGNGDAQYYVGKMYAYNVGYSKDNKRAQDWLNKAAIQGVVEAERELTKLRESLQRAQLANRRAEAKRLAEKKAREEEQRQQAAKQARQQAAAKQAARSKADQQAEADRAAADRAEAERQEQLALERERAQRRDKLLKQRQEREEARKAKFESDPCSGKSARFLSTCR